MQPTLSTSLYEQLGGSVVLSFVVDRFCDRVLADEQLRFFFAGVDLPALKHRQIGTLSRMLRGPPLLGRSYRPTMESVSLSQRHTNRLLEHFLAALVAAAIPGALMEQIATAFGTLAPYLVSRDRQDDALTLP